LRKKAGSDGELNVGRTPQKVVQDESPVLSLAWRRKWADNLRHADNAWA
jgi:hypothetical protein